MVVKTKESSGIGNNYKIVNEVFFVTCKQSHLNTHHHFLFQGSKCEYALCKGCCRRKTSSEVLDCEGEFLLYCCPNEPI